MENKKGKRQMKWQLSNKGKRKPGRAADGNAAPGGRGGTQQGAGVGAGAGRKEGATHNAAPRAGPAGGWHRGNSLMPQRAFCRGTGQGSDLCSASGWVMAVLRSLGELGWNPAVPGKSLPKLSLAFIDFTVQWRFRTLGIWLTEVENNWGRLDVFHDQLWVSDFQYTHERQDSGSEWRHSLRHNHVPHWAWEPHPAVARGCQCHLPPTLDSWDAVRSPGANLEKGDKQDSAVLPMGLTKFGPQLHALKTPALGFPRGEEAAGRHPGQSGSSLGTAVSLGAARPCWGSAACTSACFLGAEQKSKMPSAKNHV